MTILAETEIKNAKGQRVSTTAIRDDDGTRTVVGIESASGRTVHSIELDGAYALRPRHMTQEDFQRLVGEWGERTFPDSTLLSIMAHLREEVSELDFEVRDWTGRPGPATEFGRIRIGEEIADCYLLMLHLAHRVGIDLGMAAAEKFAKNQHRTWHDDGRGYAKHVEDRDDA